MENNSNIIVTTQFGHGLSTGDEVIIKRPFGWKIYLQDKLQYWFGTRSIMKVTALTTTSFTYETVEVSTFKSRFKDFIKRIL